MSVRVQKYGGSSVATTEQIEAIAERVSVLARAGQRMIVVVSAMGDTTDDLASLALKITDSPNRRELDMLLSTGERVTMALLSIAINARGSSAISFTGSQAGIFTDGSHNNARIVELKPTRVESELATGSVVILAGFQGVNPVTKEITTLGRGGSDLTAVAMAAHFKSECCEIMKDVDGVYTADPRIVAQAKHVPSLSYEELLEMTFWGSQVLHHRSVEMAQQNGVPIVIRRSDGGSDRLTRVSASSENGSQNSRGQMGAISVNSHEFVCRVESQKAVSMAEVVDRLKTTGLPLPEILTTETTPGTSGVIYLTGPSELLVSLRSAFQTGNVNVSEAVFSSITITFAKPPEESVSEGILALLERKGCSGYGVSILRNSLTVFIDRTDRKHILQSLHASYW